MLKTIFKFEMAGFSGDAFSVEDLKREMADLRDRFSIAKGTEYRIFRGVATVKANGDYVAQYSATPAKIGFVGE